MSPDDLQTAMEQVGVYWSGTMTSAELLTWKRNLRPLELEQLIETLDGLACSGVHNRWRPAIGVVMDAYRAKSRAKYAPQPIPVAPAIPKDKARRFLAEARDALGPTRRVGSL